MATTPSIYDRLSTAISDDQLLTANEFFAIHEEAAKNWANGVQEINRFLGEVNKTAPDKSPIHWQWVLSPQILDYLGGLEPNGIDVAAVQTIVARQSRWNEFYDPFIRASEDTLLTLEEFHNIPFGGENFYTGGLTALVMGLYMITQKGGVVDWDLYKELHEGYAPFLYPKLLEHLEPGMISGSEVVNPGRKSEEVYQILDIETKRGLLADAEGNHDLAVAIWSSVLIRWDQLNNRTDLTEKLSFAIRAQLETVSEYNGGQE